MKRHSEKYNIKEFYSITREFQKITFSGINIIFLASSMAILCMQLLKLWQKNHHRSPLLIFVMEIENSTYSAKIVMCVELIYF